MDDWGNEMFVTPGVVVDGELVTTNLVDINLGIRILLGSSYYEDWENEETFVDKDPLGNPVDKRHPWNQTTLPKPQKRDLDGGNYSWVMSPRWYDKRTGDYLALDTGGGALARLWATALANKVAHAVRERHRRQRDDRPAEDAEHARDATSSGRSRSGRTRSSATARGSTSSPTRPAWRCTSSTRRFNEVRSGNTKVFEDFDVPDEAIGCGFHEAVRGVLSHHLVIRDGKIANYHPYPPTPWNGSPTDSYGTPGPYEDAVMGQPIFEENGQDDFRGIDIMRAVRSFDPCLPCGVHMYLGEGKTLKQVHSPMFGAQHGGEAMAMDDLQAREQVARVETLCSRRSRASRPGRARERDRAGAGAARPLRRGARAARGHGRPTRPRSPDDELVSHLLLLHGIHPVPVEARVRAALEEVRPYLESHGGDVELVAVEDGVVRLRMEGSCSGCPSSAMTLKLAIEDAIHKARPGGRARSRPRTPPRRTASRRRCIAADPAGAARAGGDGHGETWATVGRAARSCARTARCCKDDRAASRCCSCELDGHARTPTARTARPAAQSLEDGELRAARAARAPAAGTATTSTARAGAWTSPSSTSSRCRCWSTTPGS